ncbi:MAG: phytoene desaturase family protein [Anaerolineales bacterium]|nr:phytoene desaturase family protein [Anaerolineales bacterium]
MSHQPIFILGAGIGGLSAAIHLAARGRQVIVLEQNPAVGGKMAEITAHGFRWDTGPSLITMRPVFEELFQSAGRRLEDYLTLLPLEPLTRYFWPDGVRLDLSRDLPKTAAQITALEPRDLEGYLDFLAEAARLARITGPVFTYGPPPALASLKHVTLKDALSVDVVHSLQESIERRIRHPHLRQLLGRFATYVGASPYLAPATLAVIAHVELTEGVWYPQGGIYAIARAYEKLARELGVEIRLNTRVKEICLHGGQVSGLILENGEILPAESVISNLDVTSTYGLIQSKRAARRLDTLKRRDVSCSGMILLLAVEGTHPDLAHHNIFFSSDYRHEFEQIFSARILPDDPTLYLCVTSKTDASHAPEGCENWFVMSNAPALDSASSTVDKAAVTETLLTRLASLGLDVRNKIRYQQLLTPLDIQQRTGAYRGALYGVSFNDRFAPFKRPHNRSEFEGLYFAGGSTHPGGGVPMVTLSGKLAAEMITGYGDNAEW